MKRAWLLVLCGLVGLVALCGCTTMQPPADPNAPLTDRQIAGDVLERLGDDAVTGSLALGVTVEQGIVTLRGSIPNEMVRMRAVGIARNAPGVKDVVDQLQLRL